VEMLGDMKRKIINELEIRRYTKVFSRGDVRI
jgi:hypothetical protein